MAAEPRAAIPALRIKTKREHRVPLSDAALAVLKTMSAARVDECVFPDRGAALSHMARCRVLIALGRTNISVHTRSAATLRRLPSR